MFKKLDDGISVSPQITAAQVAEAKAMGFTLIVNNRPDGEAPDQTPGDEIAAAAAAAGLDYVAIPVGHGGISGDQLQAMAQALDAAAGPVLAYCRSGTRSTMLWALASASHGADVEALTAKAAVQGYDLGALLPTLRQLSAQAQSRR